MASRIILGTVQFGQDYGIANTRGQVPATEVAAILDYAASVGIDSLDTAVAYGVSESVLGKCLKKHPGRFKVVSKIPALEQYKPGMGEAFLTQSMRTLGVEKLYGYMLHRSGDILKYEDLWDELMCLKKDGKVEKIGCSLYSPGELVALTDRGIDMDMIQIPYSVFDRRFEPYLEYLDKRGIEIQARSAFLQGLAFLAPEHLPPFLEGAKFSLMSLQKIAAGEAVSRETICLGFVLLNPLIGKVVIGIDGLDHLKKNMESISAIKQVASFCDRLQEIKIDQEDVLLPYKWDSTLYNCGSKQ